MEVAHEALLGQWERLRSWVDERREDLLLHRRLAEAVQEWEESGREEDYLPREGRLAQFESWAAATDIGITEGEREYLAAGRRRADERRRRTGRRRRAVLVALAVAAAVSAVLAALALVSRERATDQEALATSRELAASSIAVLDRDPELSVLLALEAAEAAEPTYESVSALHEGLREHRTLWTLQREPEEGTLLLTDSTLSGSLSPDGQSVLVARLNRLEVWDVATAARHGGTSSSRRASASRRASRRTESRSSEPSPGPREGALPRRGLGRGSSSGMPRRGARCATCPVARARRTRSVRTARSSIPVDPSRELRMR